MRKLLSFLFRSFLQGLLILSPIVLTAYVIYTVFDSVDRLIPWVPRGLGFLVIISLVSVVGYLGTRFFIGRMLFDAFDYLLEHIPGIKFIYTSIKDIMGSFVGDKRRFNEPVWVRIHQSPPTWRIGFLTQKDMTYLGMPGKVAVYLPHSYAVSGYVILTEREFIIPINDMSPAEAMKFAVSGGITNYSEQIDESRKQDD